MHIIGIDKGIMKSVNLSSLGFESPVCLSFTVSVVNLWFRLRIQVRRVRFFDPKIVGP